MDQPPSYDSIIASEGTRYYIVNIPIDTIANPHGAISINRTDPLNTSPQKVYHVALQDVKGFQLHRGKDGSDPVAANVTFRSEAPMGVDIALANGLKASMDVDGVRKSNKKSQRQVGLENEEHDKGQHIEKSRAPVKIAGDAQPKIWEISRKVVQEQSSSILKRAKTSDVSVDLRFFEDDRADAGASANFISTVAENGKSKDKEQKNEWGYLEIRDGRAFLPQQHLELVLTTLVCVLEMNSRVNGSKRTVLGTLGMLTGSFVVLCSVM